MNVNPTMLQYAMSHGYSHRLYFDGCRFFFNCRIPYELFVNVPKYNTSLFLYLAYHRDATLLNFTKFTKFYDDKQRIHDATKWVWLQILSH